MCSSSSICIRRKRVFGRHPRERDAGHLGDDLGDDVLVDDAAVLARLLAPFLGDLLLLLLELVGLIAQAGRLLEVLVGDRLFLLAVERFDLVVDLLQIRRLRHALEPHAGARFVDHVDRLVRQAAAGDVAVRQLDGRLDRVVGDLHAVVLFVPIAQAVEDLDRVLGVRRLDEHFLEPASQGRVLLDVLAVLVERRGADALDFAAGQGRLEHVRGVDRAFRAAGADQRVQLVDEQDRVLRPADFVHHRLDPLFELAAVLRAGDHHRQVEHHDPAVEQQLRHVAVDHALGEAFDDGRLADARFAEQHRVVLGAAAEDLDRPFDFVLAADDRVELLLAGQLGEVAAEAVERGRLAAALAAFAASPPSSPTPPRPPRSRLGAFEAVAEQVENFLADFFQLQAEVHEHLGGHAFLLAQQAEQDVLGADVVVVQVAGLFHRVFDDLLGPRRLRQLAHRDHVGSALDELLDLEADLAQIDVEVLQHVGGDAAALFDEAQQHVLGADVFVVEALGLLIGQLHHLAGAVGKSFVHFRLRCNRPAAPPIAADSADPL